MPLTPIEAIKQIQAIIADTDLTVAPPVEPPPPPPPPPVEPEPPVVQPGILATPATLAAALAAAKGGETILLAAGTYPAMTIGNAYASPVTLKSAVGKTARVQAVHFPATARNITLSNLSIWRDAPGSYVLRSYEGAVGLVIEDCDIRAIEDSVNFMSWPQAKWLEVNTTAIDMRSGATIRRCKVTGVGRALLMGKGSIVENNVLDGMTQDGLRGGSNSVFRRNLVKNFFKVDSTHRDAFQSYSGSTVVNLRVEDNVFIAHTHDGKHPLRGDPQGVGMFDGFYEDFIIKGNTILTTHYHGITILGARRGLITDNTVVNIDGANVDYPWIRVDNHKDGRPSEATSITNNRAMKISAGPGVTQSGNTIITDPKKVIAESGAMTFNPLA